jgi:hypothetical protein
MSVFPAVIQCTFVICSQSNKTGGRNKRDSQVDKEEVILSLFEDYMNLYLKD